MTAPTLAPTFPPGPPPDFIGGHLLSLRRDSLDFVLRSMQDYGGLVHIKFHKYDAYLVTEPDLVQQILTRDNRIWHKSIVYKQILADYLGDGLIVSDGDHWKRQRKLMQPAFHINRINAYAQTMVDYTAQMLSEWADGQVRDLSEEMMKLTLFIVGKTLFDADLKEASGQIAVALEHMLQDIIVESRELIPLPAWVPTPLRMRKKRTIAMLEEAVMPIIEQRRKNLEDHGDLLSMLLLAQDDEGGGMTNDQVRNEALTLVLAGHETTANTLTWTLYLLSLYPEVEAKLQAEVDQVLQGRAPNLSDLAHLPYTEMVIKEGMRIYNPVWSIGRQNIEATTLAEYPIGKRSTAIIPIWAMHRNPKFFPDPERFIPERFSPENESQLHKYAYLPFGGGPRVCIGNSFAMMEARLILASIVQRYRFSLVNGHKVEPEPLVTLRPRYGMKMQLHARQ